MLTPSHNPAATLPPESIGDYRVVSALSATAFRALGPGDKQVILKRFDNDCLQRGQLHPGIHARLSRVRELAHPGVANLHSVERDIPYLFAVWDDVPGLPIDRYVATQQPGPLAIGRLCRELILVVESLHALGIVHGRIHANNVLIDDHGNIRLTHISPLLYDDPAIDELAVLELLTSLTSNTPLAEIVAEAAVKKLPLRTVSARLAVSVDNAAAPSVDDHVDSDTGVRWATLALAAGLLIFGIAAAWVIYSVSHRS